MKPFFNELLWVQAMMVNSMMNIDFSSRMTKITFLKLYGGQTCSLNSQRLK